MAETNYCENVAFERADARKGNNFHAPFNCGAGGGLSRPKKRREEAQESFEETERAPALPEMTCV